MESSNQLQQFEKFVRQLDRTSWLSEAMQSQVGGTNQFVYSLWQGMNDLVLSFTISLYQDSGDHVVMFEGKIYWDGEKESISYLSLGSSRLLSTGSIKIEGDTWYSSLKWIEPEGKTTELTDTMTVSDNQLKYHTEVKSESGEYQLLSQVVWTKMN